MKPQINFPDFEKLDIRVGLIEKAEDHPNADKLYVLTVDFGKEIGKRTICAGLKPYMSVENLEGKKSIFLINLAPRELRGVTSEGMILAAGNDKKDSFTILCPEEDMEPGSKIS